MKTLIKLELVLDLEDGNDAALERVKKDAAYAIGRAIEDNSFFSFEGQNVKLEKVGFEVKFKN